MKGMGMVTEFVSLVKVSDHVVKCNLL